MEKNSSEKESNTKETPTAESGDKVADASRCLGLIDSVLKDLNDRKSETDILLTRNMKLREHLVQMMLFLAGQLEGALESYNVAEIQRQKHETIINDNSLDDDFQELKSIEMREILQKTVDKKEKTLRLYRKVCDAIHRRLASQTAVNEELHATLCQNFTQIACARREAISKREKILVALKSNAEK